MPANSPAPTKVVVLASGSGTLLQALLDAQDGDGWGNRGPYTIAAVGSDVPDCRALLRATDAGVPTFVVSLQDHPDRASWDRALADRCAGADLIVSAGFMKLVGVEFLSAFPGRMINSHPSLLPSFPGMHAPRDALAYGVTVTGCTIFVVDSGIDAGPIVAQRAVSVAEDDDAESLHERIKVAERSLLVEVVTAMAGRGWDVVGRKVKWR